MFNKSKREMKVWRTIGIVALIIYIVVVGVALNWATDQSDKNLYRKMLLWNCIDGDSSQIDYCTCAADYVMNNSTLDDLRGSKDGVSENDAEIRDDVYIKASEVCVEN